MKYHQVEKCHSQLMTLILALTKIIIGDLNANAVAVILIMLLQRPGQKFAGALRLCTIF